MPPQRLAELLDVLVGDEPYEPQPWGVDEGDDWGAVAAARPRGAGKSAGSRPAAPPLTSTFAAGEEDSDGLADEEAQEADLREAWAFAEDDEGAADTDDTSADAEHDDSDASADDPELAYRGAHRRRRHESGVRREQWWSVPEALRGARTLVTTPAVVGVLVIALAVAAVTGVRWYVVRSDAAAQPVAQQANPSAASTPGGQSDDGAADAGSPWPDATPTVPGAAPTQGQTASTVTVHVDGAVREPGVVSLAPTARVADAVEAAGGTTGKADTREVNLARPVADGEKIYVPVEGEEAPEVAALSGSDAGGADGAADDSGGGSGAGPINLNTATQSELETLSGVGPVTAERILAWREENGQFTSVDELIEVSGIGEKTLETLRPQVTV